MVTKEVHISTINIGDTVFHDGHIRTVGKANINKSSFMGTSIFGDSYRVGRIKVLKVIEIN